MRARLAYEMKWTLEYIDDLSLQDVGDLFSFLDAKAQIESGD